MMRVLILAHGEPPPPALAQRLALQNDLLLATDGAAHTAAQLGLTPDTICGDFDSVQLEQARAEFPHAEFVATPDQNLADLEKAILLAMERGATAVTLIGASGGRTDHALANYALLLRYNTALEISLVDAYGTVRALSGTDTEPGTLKLDALPGDTISLLSFDGRAYVSITGVAWELDNYQLPIGTQGVSNVARAEIVRVSVRGGAMLVCHLPLQQV